MKNQVLFLVCAFLAGQVSSTAVSPRDLAAEAQEQLEELATTVQGQILVAHSDLEDLEYDFITYGTNVLAEGTISIEQEHETVKGQIDTVKELAANANRDISSCTDIREELIDRLPEEYTNILRSCITEQNKQEVTLVNNAKYTVDIAINKVHNLEFQLRQCRGEILCISPIVTEIQLDKIRLPQNIRTEVAAAEALLATLRLSVDTCSDTSVSGYISDVSALLDDLIDCANRILG